MAFVSERSASGPCHYKVPPNWRGHMGGHIIRKLRNPGESERDKVVGESHPCGFCGRSARPECGTTIKPKCQSFEINSNLKCRCMVSFQHQMANKGSATTPSSYLCPTPPGRYPTYPAVWRYNMGQHLRDIHPEYVSPLQPEGGLLPFNVWQSARINKEEEMALGVPEFLVPRPFTNFVRDSGEPTRGEKRGQGSSEQGGAKRKRGGRGG
ncbi:hypothetical protein B0H13DRAFT_1633871 [Mycena leptocephala]|nr:hypothetical protein B0H13DRAFT_1633871 [Mycena leptocephala]